MSSHHKKPDPAARITLPLPGNSNPKLVADACDKQATTVLANPDVANHLDVAAAANAVQAQAKVLDDTMVSVENTLATLASLRQKRFAALLLLRILHTNLESLINVAAGGNLQKATAYGGKPVTRTVLAESTDPPVDPTAKSVKSATVAARCDKERGVLCYLFQMGGDPAHPETWPAPAMSGSSAHTFTGLTSGQKVYVRIAIVRHRGGQGEWSSVIEVVVK
jgi:hypothetical protein